MDEKDLLQRNVYDLLEESAIESTHNISQDLIQMATSPKAHSCLQGVVERRFYSVHIRDYYSIINILLLQLLLVRQRIPGNKLGEEANKSSVDKNEPMVTMQRKIFLLEREVKESKKRYKELLKINQQWAKDYTDLNKKLEGSFDDLSIPPSSSLSSSCSQCIQYVNEIDAKTELLKDLSLNFDKVKLIQSGLETRLEDTEKENKTIKDEHKVLSLQLKELGGMSVVMRYKEERSDLIEEIRRLREKVTVVERERANLQTQFNRFRHSLRDIMVDSNYRSSHDYIPQSWHSPSYASHMKTPELFTDSSSCTKTSSAPTRSNGEYVVNPKHFAPVKTNWRPLPIGYQDYNTPQTPPGYLSRGNLFEDGITELCDKPKESPKYLNLPSSHNLGLQDLPSPLSVPRPMSAPGSLIDSCTSQYHTLSPQQELKKNGFNNYPPTAPHHHHVSSNINPNIIHSAPPYKLNSFENIPQSSYFKCPHCDAKFQRTSYDIWFDHVAECMH